MNIFHLIITFISNLLSRLFAWRYDKCKDPTNISEKRRELLQTVSPNAKVLEIGAGTGSSLTAGAYDGPANRFSKIILSEPDNGMRERLQTKLEECRSKVGSEDVSIMDISAPDLPFNDEEFDAVIMYFVASHLLDRKSTAHAIAKVLKKGGKLLFMDHGAHDHAHGHEHSHEHSHHHGPKRANPWYMEWFRFMTNERPKGKMDLNEVLKELRDESLLVEEFQSRMEVDFFFKEITYGVFTRKEEDAM